MVDRESRENFVGVRLSKKEYEVIRKAAESEDRSMGSFMRISALGRVRGEK